MIKKIISGGQTGADRAALDAAIELGIPHGGWVPKGRKTEDGPLPDSYRLQEISTASYKKRTEKNVVDSDGTIIISHGNLTGGSAFTLRMAKKHNRPYLHFNVEKNLVTEAAKTLRLWIKNNRVQILNIAGPRASMDPRIYDTTKNILKEAFQKEEE